MIDAARSPWPDVAAHLAGPSGLAVLPFGALEQHGPHLPLSTDTLTAVELAHRLAGRLDAVLLPPVHYGDTWNNAGYPGTVSLAPGTVTAIAVDVGRAVSAAGGRALVVVNGDWGNRGPLYSAMRTLAADGIPAITLDHPGMAAAIEAVRESREAAPGLAHAEEVETSLVLAIDPAMVRTDRYVAEYPDFPTDFGTRPMQLHPFSASGVFGDPRTATAAKGETLLAATLQGCLDVLAGFVAGLPPR
ncbi:creatininase family protein [Modestobacter roseus]|uniref:Creatinine amidohydrolase n=1 Tax=Modestobacter roseus TaxID=1181884 RepID=A0A562IPZ0_9ACTN|nr:creatininase family protein [Modestobacter roseus]MQA35398.1 creatininase family protein [Modestobacter roseus]TWH72793.1 creatinine amidohydrolase [Modestobacter roseus]